MVSLVLGLSLGLTLKLRSPVPSVTAVFEEPDYVLKISWDRVHGARQYYVEYFYETLYPDTIHTRAVTENKITINRIRGVLKFRVKALANRDMQSGEFSDWLSYEVPGLKLMTLLPFDFIYIEEEGWKIDYNFTPVEYIYKGEIKTVSFYEFTDNHNAEPEVLTVKDMQEDWSINFPAGQTICRFRPLTYTYFDGVIIYDPPELHELYDEVLSYVTIHHDNPE